MSKSIKVIQDMEKMYVIIIQIYYKYIQKVTGFTNFNLKNP